MFLKSIKAYGFKSFADKIDLEIKPGITGIVGPNGSGKSNIVDAVKWVLGEQSVKALRGTSSMTDVIFTGSKTREEQSRATVSLVFDNSDHYLNSDFSELEIKRTLYKTGENEYAINNVKVRLKDITDLFIDSGTSKESFNIISQGKIADIISSKPEERRVIFEDAAGVLKYKKRKEESLRKLEKTEDNLSRITLIINELKEQVEPLREQSRLALEYKEYKNELEQIEIALIANDIFNINEEYSETQKNITELNIALKDYEVNTDKDGAKIEKLKLEQIKLDEKINGLSEKLLLLTKETSDLANQKQIALERQKYAVDDLKKQENAVLLKEQELSLKKTIAVLENDLKLLIEQINKKQALGEIILSELQKANELKKLANNDVEENARVLIELKNKRNIIENNLVNENNIPYAVKNILGNPRLKGIHNILGKLINYEEEYAVALDTALGFMSNVVVVDNELSAKEAIDYLKENRLGRVTFFPISVIKPRGIPDSLIAELQNMAGFIGIASNLVDYDKKYHAIITNQLGNVIVVRDMNAMNTIGKNINYAYRIVTLEGEILHTGGSLTGGTNKNSNSVISQKYELNHLNIVLEKAKEEQLIREDKYQVCQKETELLSNKVNAYTLEMTNLQEQQRIKISLKTENEEALKKVCEEAKSLKSSDQHHLDEELTKVMETYNQVEIKKNELVTSLQALKNDKDELINELAALEQTNRHLNSDYHQKQNKLKDNEVAASKMEVKLDNLLLVLNEQYSMTYEKAKETYQLTIDAKEARIKVNNLKQKIKNLGDINTGSIAEFERVNTRYTFLTNQEKDLQDAIHNLLEIINEMDIIMAERFQTMFEKIKTEFAIVFKKLFKGGQGILKLTDSSNMLETGIEIIAEPPGKKLNSIALLSGGEKSLTAIALLFAILNVKPVPFCILDEVEAALDEANVDMFGKYLLEKKDRSQFIIVTHKKRTMEYADSLYGITMQESGISKIVSVKLENIK